MKISVKLLSTGFVIMIMLCCGVLPSHAQETMELVAQEMPVLKGDIWVKMSDDEKISFIWGAGHIISIQEVLSRDNPGLKKHNIFVNKVIEAHETKSMTMSEVAKNVDDFYKENPDKLDTSVIEVIWTETILPRLQTTNSPEKSTN